MPPVISTVPSGSHATAARVLGDGGAGQPRYEELAVTQGELRLSGGQGGAQLVSGTSRSVSTRTKRPGFSAWAERTRRPQGRRAARSSGGAPGDDRQPGVVARASWISVRACRVASRAASAGAPGKVAGTYARSELTGGGVRLRRGPDPGPFDAQQRAAARAAGGPYAVHRHGPLDEGPYGGDGRPARVRQLDRDLVRSRLDQMDADGRGAGGVQFDAEPGEREPHLAVVLRPFGGVQRGVEQRRVQAEPVGARLVEGDLGEHLAPAAPGGLYAPERGPVAVSAGRVALVEVLDVDRLGVGRRPLGEDGRVGRGALAVLGQDAAGVTGPVLLAARGAGVDLDRAAARGVERADDDLDLHAGGGGDRQRCLQGQFLDRGAARLVPGADGQFDETGAGYEDDAAR